MTTDQKKKAIQTAVGVKPDGIFGEITIGAIYKELVGEEQPAPPPPVGRKVNPSGPHVCIDPGHGHSNRKPGVFDPGCTHTEGEHFKESDIVLRWAFALREKLVARGATVFMTRDNATTPTPVGSRAPAAVREECDCLVSIHVNDSDDDSANGIETLWRHDNQKAFAGALQEALLSGLGLRDRGIKERDDLAVLSFPRKAALLELGFIANDKDRAAITDEDKIQATCELLAEAIANS